MTKNPKTPLEEILFVVESTNDIVSKILECMESNKNSMKEKAWKEGYAKGYFKGRRE